MKNPWILIGVIVVVLIGGSFWYSNSVSQRNNKGVTFSPHIKGNETATVSLVEYSDFQCPACASFQPYLNDIMNDYGDKIRFEYKHFPLPMHALAEPAARAAEAAAQQGNFFAYHDVLFLNQKEWTNSTNSTLEFIKYAEQLGLNIPLFKQHLNSSLIRDKIRIESQEARSLGLTGTPTFFLNGKKMEIKVFEDFRNQIEAALGISSSNNVPVVEFGI